MRKIQLASLSLALILGGATLASAQSVAAPAPGGTPDAAASSSPTTDLPSNRPRWRHHRRHHHRLFRGVKLTTDQHAKLASIRGQYRTQAKPLFAQMRSARADYRTARGKNDTTAMTAARAAMRDTRTQFGTMRKQWVSDARGVLTPDQQAQFDKNLAKMQARYERHGAQSKS